MAVFGPSKAKQEGRKENKGEKKRTYYKVIYMFK